MSAPLLELETDVCVVGSGVAAMVAAAHLGKLGRILVLERGPRVSHEEAVKVSELGRDPFPPTQLARSHAESRGKTKYPFWTINAVGGSTLGWWGHAPRLVPNDFRMASLYGVGRDWPISYEELEPYYSRAEVELGVAGAANVGPARSREYPLPPHPLSPHEALIAPELARLGVRIGAMPQARASRPFDGRPGCCGSGTCTPYCPTNAKYTALNTHIPRAERAGVELRHEIRINTLVVRRGVVVAAHGETPDRRVVEVRAKTFLLAANAVENARILLNSGQSSGFIQSPHTGTCFMDHSHVMLEGEVDRSLERGFWPTPSNGVSYDLYDGPFRRERSAALVELYNMPPSPDEVLDALTAAMKAGHRGEGLQRATRLSWQGQFRVGFQLEVLPDPSNRLVLSATGKDPFGWPRVELHYDGWPAYTRRSAEAHRTLGERLADRLRARCRFVERDESRHLLGGTRMGASPEDSVVDRDLRYHAYPNLYVLGSGVFPTGGAANPTLLIAALSLRLADHLVGAGSTRAPPAAVPEAGGLTPPSP